MLILEYLALGVLLYLGLGVIGTTALMLIAILVDGYYIVITIKRQSLRQYYQSLKPDFWETCIWWILFWPLLILEGLNDPA